MPDLKNKTLRPMFSELQIASQALPITVRHRSRRPLAMGSLGWEQCHWCWAWRWNMYIPDMVGGPLCGDCLDRLIAGHGPAWYPNNVDRAENYLRLWLQRSGDPHLRRAATFIAREVAEHLAPWWQV